jgi:hypothetical protein
MSAMLTWAVDRARLTINHVKGFKRLYHSDRSEIIWLPEHIVAFMKVAPVEIPLILALHTGQRQGDLLRLPWSAYDGERIQLRQGTSRRGRKQGPLIEIPCTQALRQFERGQPGTFRSAVSELKARGWRITRMVFFLVLMALPSGISGRR